MIAGVVVNYGTPALTARAVASLLAEPPVTEVVVVDNGSGDGDELRRVLPPGRVRLIESPRNGGFGQGVNLGARHTDCPLLLLLNSDAVLHAGTAAVLAEAMASSSRTAAVAPRIFDGDGRPQVDAFGRFPTVVTMVTRTNRRPTATLEPDWVSGVAVLVRKEALEQVGGFDPRFAMYLEDVDLCRRLRRAGWTIRRVPAGTVTHAGGASSTTSAARDAAYHRSLLLYLHDSGHSPFTVAALGLLHRIWLSVRHRSARLPGTRTETSGAASRSVAPGSAGDAAR